MASATPSVHITLFDLPGQLDTAEKNIKEEGVEDRVSFHAIDFLKEEAFLSERADIIWMSKFLDCFSEAWI